MNITHPYMNIYTFRYFLRSSLPRSQVEQAAVYRDFKLRWESTMFIQYLKLNSLCALVGKEGGTEIVSKWMETLKGDAAKVMRNDSFWALVGREGGDEIGTNLPTGHTV